MSTLYVMVGISGSGKSTLAKTMAEEYRCVVHSSDALREELLGDAESQADNARVFDELYRRVERDLSAGTNVIADATSLKREFRKDYLGIARAAGAKCVAVVMRKPLEDCLRDNAGRERVVPTDVVRLQSQQYEEPSLEEGFDDVLFSNVDFGSSD